MDLHRTLAPSPFPGDDGQADARTRALLAGSAESARSEDYLRAVAGLCEVRLLVAVVATVTWAGQTAGGLTSDKEAEMAVVLMESADGRRALPAFTGLDALLLWRPEARPVPVTLDLAARTARSEGAVAVVVDVAGPASLVIEDPVLGSLADGRRLVETDGGEFGWVITDPGGNL